MMRRALPAFAAALLIAGGHSDAARAAGSGSGAGSGAGAAVGRVLFVTDKRAYLDRGAADGLAARRTLQIARGGRAVATCTVESVAEHRATCVGGRLRAGDVFHAGGATAKRNGGAGGARKPPPAPPQLPPLVDDGTLAIRAAALAEARIEKVDFTGKPSSGARATAVVSPGFAAWLSDPDSRSGYAEERIDGAIHGVELGSSGLRVDAAFSAQRWRAPAGIDRFRPGTATQFYLWEAEATRRERDGAMVLAVGRIWPFHTPGLTLLDGVQIGRQNDDQTAEGGAYAGVIPTALGLAPSLDVWAAGLYGALVQTGDRRSLRRLSRQEARLGIWRGPTTGAVTEAELLVETWLGRWRLGGGGRMRWAPALSAQPVAERGYADLSVRPTPSTGARLSVRYLGSSLWPEATLRAETRRAAGMLHGLADAHWDARPWLGFAGAAGAHRDGDTGRGQVHAAAEVRLLRLFGDVGGAWLGAEVEDGWTQGQSAYVQLVTRFEPRLQLIARASASATRFATAGAGANVDELGGYLSADGALTSWLRVRAWSLLRLPLLIQGEPPAPLASGVALGLGLSGAF